MASFGLTNTILVEVMECQFLGQTWGNWEFPISFFLSYCFLELRHNALRKSNGPMETSTWRKISSQKKLHTTYCLSCVHVANVRWYLHWALLKWRVMEKGYQSIKITRNIKTNRMTKSYMYAYMYNRIPRNYICIHTSNIYMCNI